GGEYVWQVGSARFIGQHAVVDRDIAAVQEFDIRLDAHGGDDKIAFDGAARPGYCALNLRLPLESQYRVVGQQLHAVSAMDAGHDRSHLRTEHRIEWCFAGEDGCDRDAKLPKRRGYLRTDEAHAGDHGARSATRR